MLNQAFLERMALITIVSCIPICLTINLCKHCPRMQSKDDCRTMNCLWNSKKKTCGYGTCADATNDTCTLVRSSLHMLQMCQFNNKTSKCEQIFDCGNISLANKTDQDACTKRSCVFNNLDSIPKCQAARDHPVTGLQCENRTQCAGYNEGNSSQACYVTTAGKCGYIQFDAECPYLSTAQCKALPSKCFWESSSKSCIQLHCKDQQSSKGCSYILQDDGQYEICYVWFGTCTQGGAYNLDKLNCMANTYGDYTWDEDKNSCVLCADPSTLTTENSLYNQMGDYTQVMTAIYAIIVLAAAAL